MYLLGKAKTPDRGRCCERFTSGEAHPGLPGDIYAAAGLYARWSTADVDGSLELVPGVDSNKATIYGMEFFK